MLDLASRSKPRRRPHRGSADPGPVAALSTWRVETCHRTRLCFDPHTGGFNHVAPSDRLRPALLVRGASTYGVLIGSPRAGDPHDAWTAVIVHLHSEGDEVCFVDPVSTLYWCAEPPLADHGLIVVDRKVVGPWERLALHDAEPDDAETQILAETTVQALLRVTRAERSWADILDATHGRLPKVGPRTMQALAQAIPDGIERLAERVARRPETVDTATDPSDPWLTAGFHDFARWIADRDRRPTRRLIGSDLDALADAHLMPDKVGRLVARHLRREIRPRRRSCIVATARNEGAYLLEWIAYHRAIGFEHIFIYSNQNDDGSDALLERLAAHGLVTFIENRIATPISSQRKAYCHALSVLPDILDYEWALFCDLDEFLVLDPSRFPSVDAFLAAREALPTDAIALQWLWYGNYGASGLTDAGAPYTHRFVTRHEAVSPFIKTICRPQAFDFAHPHYPLVIGGGPAIFRDSDGEPYAHLPTEFAHALAPKAEAAAINHYVFKSIDDCLWKFSRNPGDRSYVALRSALDIANDIGGRLTMFDRGVAATDDDRIRSCVPDLSARIAALKALPGIADQVAAIDATMRGRVAALRADLADVDAAAQTPYVQLVLALLRGEDVF